MMDISGYEGRYKISHRGDVYSILSRRNIKPFHKKGINKEDSYKRVSLALCGDRKKYSVHRLVAKAFVPNPDNKPFINHKDGDKLNNHFTNLEWVTASENQKHAYATGLNSPNNGIKFSNNTSGYVGVTKCGKKWKAQIRHNTDLYYLGVYETPGKASQVYQNALNEIMRK